MSATSGKLSRRGFLERSLAVAAAASLALAGSCRGDDRQDEAPEKPASRPAPPRSTIAFVGSFDSDGLKIHYEVFGQGKPIILVHGWGVDLKKNWVENGWVEALRPVRQVVALDCRGHGKSSKPHDQAVYSYGAMARDVLHLMDHLGIKKADLFGYSMGAFMGVHLLGHERKRFSSVVMGGIGDETEQTKDARFIAEALRAKDPSKITNPVGSAYRAYVESDRNNDLEALALSALQMWPEGFPLKLGGAGLAKVDIPVLIVDGENDHYVDGAKKLAGAIPGAKLVTIPDTDHLSVVPDERFKKAVLAFLNGR